MYKNSRCQSATGGVGIKNIANVITFSRIIFAAIMFFTAPFTMAFWVCYLCGGLSDLVDGAVARGLQQQSETGAKLDSIADFTYAIAIAFVIIKNVKLPMWLWACIICIAALRFVGYGIGYWKYHTFSALHTYANKLTGILLFAFPLLYGLMGLNASGILLCAVAFWASVEEVLITVKSKELDRECKGLHIQKDPS